MHYSYLKLLYAATCHRWLGQGKDKAKTLHRSVNVCISKQCTTVSKPSCGLRYCSYTHFTPVSCKTQFPCYLFPYQKCAAAIATFTLFLLISTLVYLTVVISQTCKNTVLMPQAAAVYKLPSSAFA